MPCLGTERQANPCLPCLELGVLTLRCQAYKSASCFSSLEKSENAASAILQHLSGSVSESSLEKILLCLHRHSICSGNCSRETIVERFPHSARIGHSPSTLRKPRLFSLLLRSGPVLSGCQNLDINFRRNISSSLTARERQCSSTPGCPRAR